MQRVSIGRDVRTVTELANGIELEGRTRLRPGRDIDIVIASSSGSTPVVRRATVWCWNVRRIAKEGLTFRGVCEWI